MAFQSQYWHYGKDQRHHHVFETSLIVFMRIKINAVKVAKSSDKGTYMHIQTYTYVRMIYR